MPNHVIVSSLGWSAYSLEDAIAAIGALEFGQVDLGLHEGWAHINPSELAGGGKEAVRREAARIEAAVAQNQMKRVSAFNVGIRVTTPSEQERQLAAVCELASALDVPVICLNAARRGTAIEDEVARLKSLLPVAADRGVQLTVETHYNQITEIPTVAARLCEAVPGLGLTLDPSHFYAGPNQGADFSAVLPFVKHVHLRDAGGDREHLQVPAGSGRVDFSWIVDQLHGAGYEGKFAIEYIDAIPIVAGAGEPMDVPANVIRMRDLFIAAERAAGIVRAPAAPTR